MKLGIVGLPNVGKSTLFNSLTKAGALSANYPFATIDPNVGIVSVPDERIVKLGELYHTKKVTPATIEFVDIAGLVKGASKGEGLGNQFLANIREVDAIVHVVRCFEDTNIIHVDGSVDPARDIETINLELIFSDVEILDRRISKIAKQARMDKTLAKELELVEAIKAHLEEGKMARTFEVPDDDDAQIWFKGYNLLTAKPTIYAANVAEDDLAVRVQRQRVVVPVNDGGRHGALQQRSADAGEVRHLLVQRDEDAHLLKLGQPGDVAAGHVGQRVRIGADEHLVVQLRPLMGDGIHADNGILRLKRGNQHVHQRFVFGRLRAVMVPEVDRDRLGQGRGAGHHQQAGDHHGNELSVRTHGFSSF